MPARLTPIGWITKFLIVPAALGALGFYVIGPKVGAVKPAPKLDSLLPGDKGSGSAAKVEGHTPAESLNGGTQKQPPPNVEVSSQPAEDSGSNLGQDSDQNSGDGAAQDDIPKPRVRHAGTSPSMAAPPTDPDPDGAPGTNGVNGANGASGTDGTDGAAGQNSGG